MSWILLVLLWAPLFVPEGRGSDVPITRQVYLMGTVATLTSYNAKRAEAIDELSELISTLEQVESELSTWRTDTHLGRLNRKPVGRPFSVPEPTCSLLVRVLDWSQRTGGAFDPAVGRLVEAWGIRGNGRLASAEEIRTGVQTRRAFDFDPELCEFTRRDDVRLDAGGFGKGAALDRALMLARDRDFDPFLINLGGQIAVFNSFATDREWTVSLPSPSDRRRVLLEIPLQVGSIATSGASERSKSVGEKRIHHVIDPATGETLSFRGSVVVWHGQALVADILSTALLVMGPEKGLKWAEEQGIAACYFVPKKNGEVDTLPSTLFSKRFLDRLP